MIRRIASNWVRILMAMVVVYIATPFTIRTLGEAAYGVWILVATLASYLGLLSLGAPLASVRYVAKYTAEANHDRLANTVSTLWVAYLLMAVTALLIGGLLVIVLPIGWDVTGELEWHAQVAMGLAVAYWAVTLVSHWPRGILTAFREFPAINMAAIAGLVVRLVLTLVVLTSWPNVIGLGVALLGSILIEILILGAFMIRRHPMVRPMAGKVDKRTLREVGGFSVFAFALNFGSQLAYQADALVIGAFLSVSVIPFYAVASSLTQYVIELILGIAEVIMPTATAAHSQARFRELRVTCFRWTRIAYSLTLLAALNLLVLGPDFLAWWIGESFRGPAGSVLMALTASLLFLLPMRGVAQPILLGVGKPKAPTVLYLATSVLNVVVSIALSGPLGLMGVALGTVLQNVLYGLALHLLISRELSFSPLKYFWYAFGVTSIGAVPVFGAMRFVQTRVDSTTLLGMVAVGCVSVATYAAVSYLFVYRKDARTLWRQMRGRIRSDGVSSPSEVVVKKNSPVSSPPESRLCVTVTIDTEEDNWGQYDPTGATVTNIPELLRVQEIFEKWGARPTYLVNYAPLADAGSVAVLGDLSERDCVEIGGHCHPWNTPPTDGVRPRRTMMCSFSREENGAKLRTITKQLTSELGLRPTSFRAGRWGFGPTVASALADEGYLVDASISPFMDWSNEGGPDYSFAPHTPYRFNPSRPFELDSNGSMVEIPTTIGFLHGDHRRRARIRHWAERSAVRPLHIIGILDRAGILARRWMSPEVSTPREMIALAARCARAGQTHVDLTFHSSTLLPGATPFVHDTSDRDRFVSALDETLGCLASWGVAFATLTELSRRYPVGGAGS